MSGDNPFDDDSLRDPDSDPPSSDFHPHKEHLCRNRHNSFACSNQDGLFAVACGLAMGLFALLFGLYLIRRVRGNRLMLVLLSSAPHMTWL